MDHELENYYSIPENGNSIEINFFLPKIGSYSLVSMSLFLLCNVEYSLYVITQDKLLNMLKTQFKIISPEQSYEKAVNRSLVILENTDLKIQKKPNSDVFYLFLHALIVEIFNKIDFLEQKLQELSKNR